MLILVNILLRLFELKVSALGSVINLVELLVSFTVVVMLLPLILNVPATSVFAFKESVPMSEIGFAVF